MIAEAIDKILSLGRTELLSIAGQNYTSRPVCLVTPPLAKTPLELHTLNAMAQYLTADPDGLATPGPRIVHVLSPTRVVMHGKLTAQGERELYAGACAPKSEFAFGTFMGLEDFVIRVQTGFVDTADRANLLRVVGNISDGTIRTARDDGVRQEVTVKTGIARVEDVILPNPVTLAPFRTFRELTQPASPFVLRLRSRSGTPSGAEAALFEADGLAWQLQAIQAIHDWLVDHTEVEQNLLILA